MFKETSREEHGQNFCRNTVMAKNKLRWFCCPCSSRTTAL